MVTVSPDEELLRRYLGGDRSAFAALVQRYQGPLLHFVMRQVRNQATAEEILQEAFVRVVLGLNDFKRESRFSTWLYTIARNLCTDELRKQKHRRHPSLDQPDGRRGDDAEGPSLGERTADNQRDTEREATQTELRARIEKALDLLPDEQREVFVLREVSGLPFKDIAEITGVSENTVKSRMRYALERLQAALDDYQSYAREVSDA